MKMNKIIGITLALIIFLLTLSGCSLLPNGGDNIDNGNTNQGSDDITDDNNGDSGNDNNEQQGKPDDGNNGDITGDNTEKPVEPDPDAGKNGIDEILLAFGENKVDDGEVNDTIVSSTVKYYTINKLDINDASNPVAMYVINHGEERVGTDSDVSIIRDLLDEYVVVVLDYQGAKNAVSPYLTSIPSRCRRGYRR